MRKYTHEIRDPIHAFIRLDNDERRVLNSRPFQRLRNIHQLALTFLVYPGGTHKRFEHSLGVMDLAGRVYDVLTDPEHIDSRSVPDIIPKFDSDEHRYWRRVLRMAALCHDLGHLPFSHAAEHEILPDGKSHEDLTIALILSAEMSAIWESMTPPLNKEHIAKLAVGKKKMKDQVFSLWEAILSEIIVGNAFGVDRIDYLLRDSHHTGVGYGRFDHYRLIDTVRMLPRSADVDFGQEPVLGIDIGGLKAAEGLIVARYFMFSQVYLHPIRIVYDKHLIDFMVSVFGKNGYSIDLDKHLRTDDTIVLQKMQEAATDKSISGHDAARRILFRDHFRKVYSDNPGDIAKNPEASRYVGEALSKEFGRDLVWSYSYTPKSAEQSFPVIQTDGRIFDSTSLSKVMSSNIDAPFGYVFVDKNVNEKANKFLQENIGKIIEPRGEDK